MSASRFPGDQGAGAGLSLASPDSKHVDPSAQSQPRSIASRALALSSYFLSGALCINLSQFLGTPLYLINQDWYNAWIAFTKQSFGLLTMTLTQTFSPTKVIVSGDASVRGQLLRKTDGTLLLDFPERIVLIANHQIYTDWLYLWWTAYCSGMHGRLYIILKESLKRIPILGWGMQFNQFIFLKRDWEKDRGHMAQALGRLNKLADPMWLLLFPEGTNLAASTRQKSANWAKKNDMKDMRHCLLPRSTGLRFCLQELKDTVDYVYDCTIAYEGVPRGAYAQDIFTLKAGYLEGRPPKSVSMYWRRFAIKNIPIQDEKAFTLWLMARWREKDLLIENYYIHGHFPADKGLSRTPQGKLLRGAGHLDVEIKSSHWYEFLQIFAPMGILAMVLYVFYGALPQKFFKSNSGKALTESAQDVKTLSKSVTPPSMPGSFNLDTIFNADNQNETFGGAGKAVAQWMQSPEAKRLMSRADLVQRWLEDPSKLLVESITGSAEKQNFLQSLKEEENRRRKLNNKHQGTFWQDLDDAESRASGSVTSKQTQKVKTGSFYQDLANAEANRNALSLAKAASGKSKASFWDELEKEKSRRTGTVITLSTISDSSSDTLINSSRLGPMMIGKSTTTSKPAKLPKRTPAKPSDKPTVSLPKSGSQNAKTQNLNPNNSRPADITSGITQPVKKRPRKLPPKKTATKPIKPITSQS